ncbi:hypothetical protein LXL04_039141 [Taraxacum kok-saghyz]
MNLPDGIQRRRTAVDELNMRTIFEENDVICELIYKVREIKTKAEQSETMVQEICRDIKKLDFAKMHITTTITALHRLTMLATVPVPATARPSATYQASATARATATARASATSRDSATARWKAGLSCSRILLLLLISSWVQLLGLWWQGLFSFYGSIAIGSELLEN